jgi:hypothetical protein
MQKIKRTIKTTRRGGVEKCAQKGFDRADIVRDGRIYGKMEVAAGVLPPPGNNAKA